MLAAVADYGPFGPAVGYAGAIMTTAGMLFFLWAGRMRKWRPPDEDLPGTAQAMLVLLCGVAMVVLWYAATPGAIDLYLATVVVLAAASVACFLRYTGLLGLHIYIKRVATGDRSTREVRILGGRELLPEAEQQREALGVDIQALLEGAAYNPDLLWSRQSRQWVGCGKISWQLDKSPKCKRGTGRTASLTLRALIMPGACQEILPHPMGEAAGVGFLPSHAAVGHGGADWRELRHPGIIDPAGRLGRESHWEFTGIEAVSEKPWF
jgi:hypothetical protein